MPADRSRKDKERDALYHRILNHGVILDNMNSCSNCVRRNRTCVSSPDSSKCAECVRRKINCDQQGPSLGDWVKLDREEERLDREEEETLSKLLRLRRQKKLLRTRGKDMLRRGLKSLDELDAVEEAERLAQQSQPSDPVPPISEDSPFLETSSLDPAAFSNLPDSFWEGLGLAPLDASPAAPSSGGIVGSSSGS